MAKGNLFTAKLGGAMSGAMRQAQDLNRRVDAYNDIIGILTMKERERADMILLRDALARDSKSMMGMALMAHDTIKAKGSLDTEEYGHCHSAWETINLALSEGSAFDLSEQFEIGKGITAGIHRELEAVKKQHHGARHAVTERVDQILQESGIYDKYEQAQRTEVKKRARHLLMREYTEDEYEAMKKYYKSGKQDVPADPEVLEFAELNVNLAMQALNKHAGMGATMKLCGYSTDEGVAEPGVLDLHEKLLSVRGLIPDGDESEKLAKVPSLIKAVHTAHKENKKLIEKCEQALPDLRKIADVLKQTAPDEAIAADYIVVDVKLCKAAEDAVLRFSGGQPVKTAIDTLGHINEEAVMGTDVTINAEISDRVKNAGNMAYSVAEASENYNEGGTGLGKSIRPFLNKLAKGDKQKLLPKNQVSVENQDAIFTFRALDGMYKSYGEQGEAELEQITRMRTEHAGKLTAEQTELLDGLEAQYKVVLAELPKVREPLEKAHTALSEAIAPKDEDIMRMGRMKAEAMVRYTEGFLAAAKLREEKFERFEKKNPPSQTFVGA